MSKLILASQSPRRKELMTLGGFQYKVIISDCEEKFSGTTPHEVVEELSLKKAVDVLNKCVKCEDYHDIIVIGADTVVAYDGNILGKPKDRHEAKKMLRKLQGNTHEVYTGVTFARADKEKIITHTFYECTEVVFNEMTEKEIDEYVSTGDCDDKAGAYGIQSGAAKYVKEIHGDYNNVVGLPLSRLYKELKNFNQV